MNSSKKTDDYKRNYQTTIKAVGRKWYIYKDECQVAPYKYNAI